MVEVDGLVFRRKRQAVLRLEASSSKKVRAAELLSPPMPASSGQPVNPEGVEFGWEDVVTGQHSPHVTQAILFA